MTKIVLISNIQNTAQCVKQMQLKQRYLVENNYLYYRAIVITTDDKKGEVVKNILVGIMPKNETKARNNKGKIYLIEDFEKNYPLVALFNSNNRWNTCLDQIFVS